MSAVLQIPPPGCDHCGDKRRVWNQWAGKEIRCVHCTTVKVKQDRSGLDQLTKDEAAQREQRAIDAGEPVKYTGHDWTVAMLVMWGRMVRDGGIGYPSMSSFEKARIGRGGGRDPISKLPPDIEVVDHAVSVAPVEHKTLLIEHYTKTGYASEKAARLGISRSAYFVRKDAAERYIATEIGA